MTDLDTLGHRNERFLRGFAKVMEPALERWFRPVVRGLDRIPDGAALYVGNHSGGLLSADTFIFGLRVLEARGIGDVPHGLAHEVVLKVPVMKQLLEALGAVPASHENAHRLFAAGRKVLVYPGGDIDSMRPYAMRDRVVFGKRRGYLRLALRERVPIVPIVAAGAHATSIVITDGRAIAKALGLHRLLRIEVLPLTFSIPWGLVLGITPPYFPLPTRIFIEALDPIRFDPDGPEAARDDAYLERCNDLVLERMQSCLTRLAAERRASR
ncbi:MAG: 1-acyl-sn-glycerol-3-phosphate acyltransferase [Sandaracinaceae bacterium]|nr:1-acyl-sn-glycerol-3-phosphate acyltransferase [Sandaracinaceae bacterium]